MLKVLILLGIIQLAFSQIKPGPVNCPDCFVTQVCGPFKWTKWLDRDLPGGNGDYETVVDAVALGGCASPIYIECQTASGTPWWKTGDVVHF